MLRRFPPCLICFLLATILTEPKVAQTCSLFSAPDGRVYRPRDCERLVLYLKDINLPRPDKYDTCMLIAFLQQLQTFGGFYDENLEFLRLERVHVRRNKLVKYFHITINTISLAFFFSSMVCSAVTFTFAKIFRHWMTVTAGVVSC